MNTREVHLDIWTEGHNGSRPRQTETGTPDFVIELLNVLLMQTNVKKIEVTFAEVP